MNQTLAAHLHKVTGDDCTPHHATQKKSSCWLVTCSGRKCV